MMFGRKNPPQIRIDGKIPTGSTWKAILGEIYRYAPHQYCEGKVTFHDDHHALAGKLRITGYKLMLGVSFLQDQKLVNLQVDTNNPYSAHLVLTEKGFNVALENQKAETAQKQQEILIMVGVLAPLLAILGFIAQTRNWIAAIAVLMVSPLVGLITALLLVRIFPILNRDWQKLFRRRQ